MIELTTADVAVILRHASTQGLDFPTAQLNDEGQTEIVRWIECVGRLDDQLSPYAWYSLAEEAAAADDPDGPIMIEMLPTYTLSGESEMLELCRMSHFDWSIDAIPVEFIQNTDELLDAGVPVRFLLLAEVAGETFSTRVIELCPEMLQYEQFLMLSAINTFFVCLCESAGIVLDEALLSSADRGLSLQNDDQVQFDAAVKEGIEAARSAILLLEPELNAAMPTTFDLIGIHSA
jgi:hypothetical protein